MTLLIIIALVLNVIVFPVIWIKIDPTHYTGIIAIVVFLYFIPAFIFWSIFYGILHIIFNVDKVNKLKNYIEHLYYTDLN